MQGFSLGQKLGAGFAIVIGLTTLEGYTSIAAIGALGDTFDHSVRESSDSAALVSDIQTVVTGMTTYTKMAQFGYALNATLSQGHANACSACHSLPDPDKAQREFAALASQLHPKLQALGATGLSAEEKQPLNRIDKGASAWVTAFDEFVKKASSSQFDAGHSIITDRIEPIRDGIENATKELGAGEAHRLESVPVQLAAVVKQKLFWLLGIQFAVLTPTIAFAWRFIRRLSLQLRALCGCASDIADGDVNGALRRLNSAGL